MQSIAALQTALLDAAQSRGSVADRLRATKPNMMPREIAAMLRFTISREAADQGLTPADVGKLIEAGFILLSGWEPNGVLPLLELGRQAPAGFLENSTLWRNIVLLAADRYDPPPVVISNSAANAMSARTSTQRRGSDHDAATAGHPIFAAIAQPKGGLIPNR